MGEVQIHWPRRATFDSTNGWRFIRDEDSCVLQKDGGTEPETISLETNSFYEDREQLANRHLQNYQRHVQENWKKHWPKVIGDDTAE